MNELAKINNSQVPAYLQPHLKSMLDANAAAMQGITGSDHLPALSIKGKCFSVRANGSTQSLNTMTLDVVIIAARPTISKIKFDKDYDPSETVSPVCASIDSKVPDFETTLADPTTGECCCNCATCFFNKFGSADRGSGKACKDYKRLIVMPASQDGKTFPSNAPAWSLDVPATSLKAPKGTNLMMLREYVNALTSADVPVNAYVVTLGFVMGSEFPQLTFTPKRWVMAEEMKRITELQEEQMVKDAIEQKTEAPIEEREEGQPTPAVQPAPTVSFEPKPAELDTIPTFAPVKQEAPAFDEMDTMAQAEALLSQFKL